MCQGALLDSLFKELDIPKKSSKFILKITLRNQKIWFETVKA